MCGSIFYGSDVMCARTLSCRGCVIFCLIRFASLNNQINHSAGQQSSTRACCGHTHLSFQFKTKQKNLKKKNYKMDGIKQDILNSVNVSYSPKTDKELAGEIYVFRL